MKKTSKLSNSAIVHPFYHSPEFQQIKNELPNDLIRQLIDAFGEMMKDRHHQAAPAQWTAKAVEETLEAVWADDSMGDDQGFFEYFFLVNGLLVLSLADRRQTRDDFATMRDTIEMVAAITDSDNVPEDEDDDDWYIEGESKYDRPGLAMWQERTLADIVGYMQRWVREFAQSSSWHRVPAKISLERFERFMVMLTQQAYNDFRKTPKTWSKAAIQGVMVPSFIEPADLDEVITPLLAPTAAVFMQYLADRHYLRPEVAGRYARWIGAASETLIEASADPDNQRPSRNAVNAITQAGVDLNDQKAVDAFVNEYNQVTAVQRLLQYKDYAASAVYFPSEAPDSLPHVQDFEGHKWSLRWASRMRSIGLELARRLWSNPDDDSLRSQVSQQAAVQTVVAVFDNLYAEKVLTPKRWTVADLEGEVAKLRQHTSGPGLTQRLLAVKAMIAELAAAAQIAKPASEKMLALISAAIPKAGGKVISLKAARKLKAHRAR